MALPFTQERRLALSPALGPEDYAQVKRWCYWPYYAVILTCGAAIIEIMAILTLIIAPHSKYSMWPVVIACAVAWIIAMDHRVFWPVKTVRKLFAQGQIVDMLGSPSWDTYVAEFERINTKVDKKRRSGLHNELFLAVRRVTELEAIMEQHGTDGPEPNVSLYQDALAERTRALANVSLHIDEDTKPA